MNYLKGCDVKYDIQINEMAKDEKYKEILAKSFLEVFLLS